MKNICVIAILLPFAFGCSRGVSISKTPYVNKEIIHEKGDTILAGNCMPYLLKTGTFKPLFSKSFETNEADTVTVKLIAPLLQNKSMEIFLGSWCGDSKREVPHMMKILEAASFDTTKLKLIFVDNTDDVYKQSPQHEEKGKFIHHVPTFIVYDDNKEMGRITETPAVSLEKDLLAILSKQLPGIKYKAIDYWIKNIPHKNKQKDDASVAEIAVAIKPLCRNASELNTYGYVLMAQKNFTEAENIYRLNAVMYPEEPNVYDSLGEFYTNTGNKLLARKFYEKVLQLKPGDENAVKMLEKF